MIFVYIVLGGCAVLAVWALVRRSAFRRRRLRLLGQALPAAWDAILRDNVPIYQRLPEDSRAKLGGYVNAFLAEKNFEACGGLDEVTEEMAVTVAGQACLLLLNDRCGLFERLRTVILYPDIFSAEGGIDHDGYERGREERLGESWETGSVVLSWHHVLHGPETEQDGHNVVLHEFAHQLDQRDGVADGAPVLGSLAARRRWAEVFRGAFERHRSRRHRGQRLVIDDYGGSNPAEFFAVATETFFERPKKLSQRYPELYEELKVFYALDPVTW